MKTEIKWPFFVGLALWSLLVFTMLFQVMQIPYLGLNFADRIEPGRLVVVAVDAGSPADKAGVRTGQEFVAIINWTTNKRYHFTGLEALKGRTKLHSYEITSEYFKSLSDTQAIFEGEKIAFEDKQGWKYVIDLNSARPWGTHNWRIAAALFLSLIILLIALGIWTFAPRSMAVRLLAISGLSLSLNMLSGAISHSVEFQMPIQFHHIIYILNTSGSLIFSYGLIAFLWHFPTRINKFPFAIVSMGLGFLIFLSQYFQWFEFPLHPYQVPNLIPFPIAAVISLIQWRRTRNNPIDRASMMWVMMTVFGFTAIVIMLYSIPILLHFPPLITPFFATVALAFIYLGIALGTLRYRLFDIHRIWWKAVTWLAGGFVVLLTDVLLVSLLNLEQKEAIPLALLLAGWLYFPIRQAILGLFVENREVRLSDNIPRLIDMFSKTENTGEFDGRLAAFLRDVFKASEIGELGRTPVEATTLEQSGLAMRVPNISASGSLLLIGKAHGRQIFSPRDAQTADTFVSLSRNMNSARKREFATLQRDRERIVRDLHDDVGGRLLSMIYQSEDEKLANQARDALGALKESLIVVEDAETIEFSLAWKQIKREIEKRYEAAKLPCKITENFESERVLSAREFVNLKRIFQELVSNSLKYSNKQGVISSLHVDLDATISFSCKNEFRLKKSHKLISGRGLSNIRKRLEEIGGNVEITREEKSKVLGRYETTITVPIMS